MKQRKLEIRYSGSVEEERKQVAFLWNELYASNRRVKAFIGIGSAGKTFSPLKYLLRKTILEEAEPFCYVVDNDETRKLLCQDGGENFWTRIAKYCGDNELTTALTSGAMTNSGISLKYNKRTIAHIIPFSQYMKYKNLSTVTSAIFLDEFIPETQNYNNKTMDEKIQSLSQTLERDTELPFIMCANPKTLNNPLLINLGLDTIKPNHIGYTKDACIVFADGNMLPCIEAMNKKTIGGILGSKTKNNHRISGVVVEASVVGIKDKFLFNFVGNGFEVGVYKHAKPKSQYYVISDFIPKGKTYAQSNVKSKPNCIVHKLWFDAFYKTFQSGKVTYDTLDNEQKFYKIFGVKV